MEKCLKGRHPRIRLAMESEKQRLYRAYDMIERPMNKVYTGY